MLVMSHYLKRMQNLRKRLRAQSLRAKINLTTQDDSVLLYEGNSFKFWFEFLTALTNLGKPY